MQMDVLYQFLGLALYLVFTISDQTIADSKLYHIFETPCMFKWNRGVKI